MYEQDYIMRQIKEITAVMAKVLLDVKGIYALEVLKASGLRYWRL